MVVNTLVFRAEPRPNVKTNSNVISLIFTTNEAGTLAAAVCPRHRTALDSVRGIKRSVWSNCDQILLLVVTSRSCPAEAFSARSKIRSIENVVSCQL